MDNNQTSDQNLIILSLEVDEVNLLLQALGERPFKEVYDLVGKINDQAYEQMVKASHKNPNNPK